MKTRHRSSRPLKLGHSGIIAGTRLNTNKDQLRLDTLRADGVYNIDAHTARAQRRHLVGLMGKKCDGFIIGEDGIVNNRRDNGRADGELSAVSSGLLSLPASTMRTP